MRKMTPAEREMAERLADAMAQQVRDLIVLRQAGMKWCGVSEKVSTDRAAPETVAS